MILIGHKKQWEFLKNAFEMGQLSHAYLFTGAKEIGKKTLAVEFIKFINCSNKEKKPCQKCFNCQAIEKGSFPDFKIITRKEDKKEIEISQIREAQKFLGYKSYYGAFKTVVVDDAELMNQEAQSCFLKTLEEPKGKTLLILISSRPDMLLPTIFSRCQTLKFYKPKDLPENKERLKREQQILKNLLPVIDSGLAEKFKFVKSLDFEEQDLNEMLEVMQKHFRNLLLAEVGIGGTPSNKYPISKIKSIINLIEDINSRMVFTNASPKLALEILLMEI